MNRPRKQIKSSPRYFIFSEYELITLLLCLVLDVSEYVVTILIMPVVGDLLDIAGIIASFFMFRLVGVISLLELVPGADILPIYVITWLVWYYLKKQREQGRQDRRPTEWR